MNSWFVFQLVKMMWSFLGEDGIFLCFCGGFYWFGFFWGFFVYTEVKWNFLFSLSFFFYKKSGQGLAIQLPFHPSSKVVPAQGWHTPGTDTRLIPLVRITLSSHPWCPFTSLCLLEGPVTPWAVVLDINISLHFISWAWSGSSQWRL